MRSTASEGHARSTAGISPTFFQNLLRAKLARNGRAGRFGAGIETHPLRSGSRVRNTFNPDDRPYLPMVCTSIDARALLDARRQGRLTCRGYSLNVLYSQSL